MTTDSRPEEKATPVRKKLRMVRRAAPELGRWRLILVLFTSWPIVLFTFVSWGNRIPRLGYWVPTLMIAATFTAAKFLEFGVLDPTVALSLGLGLAILGSWGVFGVISTVFNMPVSEGVLSRIEQLVDGIPSTKKNAEYLCIGLAEAAWQRGLKDDYAYFKEAGELISDVVKLNNDRMRRLHQTMDKLRKRLEQSRQLLRTDCLVNHFTETLMVFLATVFAFALLTKAASFIEPDSFDPKGKMSYFDSVYYSFTTVTTTDFGDIMPVSRFTRFVTVWEECLGVAFMTIVIGAACEMFQRSNKVHYRRGSDERINGRIFEFARRLFADYEVLSKPRKHIDELVDGVERRAIASGLISSSIREVPQLPRIPSEEKEDGPGGHKKKHGGKSHRSEASPVSQADSSE